jgi:hypothetical protein
MSAKPNLLYNPNCALLAILVGQIILKKIWMLTYNLLGAMNCLSFDSRYSTLEL